MFNKFMLTLVVSFCSCVSTTEYKDRTLHEKRVDGSIGKHVYNRRFDYGNSRMEYLSRIAIK